MEDDLDAARFIAIAQEIAKAAPLALDASRAAIIAAVHLGVGNDSRSLSKRLGIAHALVLRDINALAGTLLTVARRDARTQRTFVALTDEGEALARAAFASLIDRPLVNS